MNHLQAEKSPYLQMHSQNPVDWYPWCGAAFEKARREDKPVFLSIGYSACHWCHVIAHESFEDEGIAALLGADYVSVKVDKEERPDVDAVYMDAVELATGSGGWPMTLLITPEGEPFFAATYLPKATLRELLQNAADLWRHDRASVLRSAGELTRQMRALADRPQAAPRAGEDFAALCDRAAKAYAAAYDGKWGGFSGAPKFPSAHNLLFLLAHSERTGDERALSVATGTLDAMFRGGLFDHIGGGFCRYSVDRQWLIPHFEKMLYDNALLLWAYASAWRLTRKPLYQTVARRTAEYVLRELTDAEGAFYCAQDADSEGREGAYYVFTPEELRALLGKEDGDWFCRRYGITDEGNFEGRSHPNLLDDRDFEREDERLQALRERVYEYRRARLPLGLDDKVLTSWNGLMIAALCEAARALDEPRYLEAARRAERFLRERVTDEGGEPLLRWRDGEAKGAGVLADYAYVALPLTALHRATGERGYLERAESVAERMLERFGDDGRGLYLYSSAGEQLVTRPKELWDGAMPSGNSCAALALLRLAEATGENGWQERAEEQLRFMAGAASERPTGYGFALLAMEEKLTD